MRRTAIVLVFTLLAGCAPETSQVSPSAVVTERAPEQTAEIPTATHLAPTASPAVTADCARGDYFDQIQSGGQTRQYLLHVPAGYKPEESAALVLVFHGAGIGAERFVDYSRFSRVADREGFLIVYPQGLGERPVWDPSPGSRDVQFVSDLLDHLQARCNIDLNRIFASGHSNGGGMANRLACELADRIAAIGTVSGAYQSAGCFPARPIPVFAIHGTADPIVPYEGIPEWAAAWAERNGCDPEPLEVVHNVLIGEMQWGNCRAGGDVILYTIQDLGHDWTHDIINFGQTIWEFFKEHPMNKGTS